MNRHKKRDWLLIFDQAVVIGVAILVFLFVFADLVFDFLNTIAQGQFPTLSAFIPKFTLFVLGYLFLSIAIERKKRLDTIQATLDGIVNNSNIGAQYLEDLGSVNAALERMIRQADETVMSLGSRSRAVNYLSLIQEGVSQHSIIYYRLLEGPKITHELCVHLKAIIQNPNVQIAWTPKEKFGNLTVTEHECTIAFPAPYWNKLSGLRLPGEASSRRYSQYFLDAFSKGMSVRTETAVESLCSQCSPDTAGHTEAVKRVIANELKSFVDKQTGVEPDLL